VESGDLPSDSATFEADGLADPEMLAPLRAAIAARGVERLYELHHADEGAHGREVEGTAVDPGCSDDDRYWTDATFAWLVYANGGEWVTVVDADLVDAVLEGPPSWAEFGTSGATAGPAAIAGAAARPRPGAPRAGRR
jgi:hypothetical protein